MIERITRSGRPTGGLRQVTLFLMVLVAILPSLVWAKAYLVSFAVPGDFEPFTDGLTYLAAGERLNAGHDLYRLGPGDRPVPIVPPTFTAPLVSPPPIAVLWRPLAAFPFGFAMWVAVVWLALLGTIAYLVVRVGWIAVALAVVLAEPIGDQLAVANVAALFPALLVIAWLRRGDPRMAGLLGVMAALKISPGTMLGWPVGQRNWRAAGWAVGGLVAMLLIGFVGAGLQAHVDYIQVARSTQPSPESLSGITGISWLTVGTLIAGTIAAALIRRPVPSFSVALIASVIGNPALYHAAFVPLLGLLAPLIPAPEGTTDGSAS